MKLNLKFLLKPQLKGSPVSLSFVNTDGSFKILNLSNDNVQTFEYLCDLNYFSLPDFVKIFNIEGFVPGLNQKIIISEMSMNHRENEVDFNKLLAFSVRNNKFISDHTIGFCHEICFNGDLLLSIKENKSRLFWCPYYFSDKKDNFVFNNSLLDDYGDESIIPYRNDKRSSIKKYRNEPHHDYSIDKSYSFACFGCSVTYGVALNKKDVWSNLICKNSINLAVPGLGFDGIFLNLKNALKKFQFQKIIILLPNFERKLVRCKLPQLNSFFQFPISAGSGDWHHSRIKHWSWEMMGIYFNKNQIDEWKKNYIKTCHDMVMAKDSNIHNIYSKKVFSRLISLLLKSKKKFWLSSWDEEVYEFLNTNIDDTNLLPFFNLLDLALDNEHPGPLSHKRWIDQIKGIVF